MIGDYRLLLPPGHQLPNYQRQFPTYDNFFQEPLRRLATTSMSLEVIDVGANVGDTALAIVSAIPDVRVICVEGSPTFLTYLAKNTHGMENVRVVRAFVTPDGGHWDFTGDSSTGHLESVETSTAAKAPLTRVTPSDLCAMSDCEVVVWKSDTDGLDLPILLSGWEDITGRCSVLWLEFDPILTHHDYVDAFLERLPQLNRDLLVFDNFGLRMLRVPASGARKALGDLTGWLIQQDASGYRRVNYLDIWVAPSTLMDVMFGESGWSGQSDLGVP